MNLEIERKFLVSIIPFDEVYFSENIEQGYLSTDVNKTIRVRTIEVDNNKSAFICIKSKSEGISRFEYEYEIPTTDANQLFKMCDNTIIKTRHLVQYENHLWEIDQFFGKLDGLILAEVELQSEDEKVMIPDWVTKEVSDDPQYFNSNLSKIDYLIRM